jgi:hypothetical protein
MGKSSLPRLREGPYTYAPQKGAIFVSQPIEMDLEGACQKPPIGSILGVLSEALSVF